VGRGENERGLSPVDGRELVRINPALYRPAEVDLLLGDSTKAHRLLGWRSATSLEALCAIMVRADLARVERELMIDALAGRPVRRQDIVVNGAPAVAAPDGAGNGRSRSRGSRLQVSMPT
jgi:hypothetical protein